MWLNIVLGLLILLFYQSIRKFVYIAARSLTFGTPHAKLKSHLFALVWPISAPLFTIWATITVQLNHYKARKLKKAQI